MERYRKNAMADVLAWDQEAPEIEKKTVLTEKWVTKY